VLHLASRAVSVVAIRGAFAFVLIQSTRAGPVTEDVERFGATITVPNDPRRMMSAAAFKLKTDEY
jgi:hypothetical protein